ncbi:MAG: cytochrome c [Bacteroidales bacterium]|nr:cytochrome c [Bacteroidales bacterium]
MKKIKHISFSLSVFLIVSILASCTNNQEQKEETQNNEEQKIEQITKEQESNTEESTATAFEAGEKIYNEKCMVCHQKNGEGVEGTFPPLANSDYLLANKERAILQTLRGSKNPITVNGVEYPGNVMTVFKLTNQEIANVVNYVLNSWGNKGGTVTVEEVKAARAKIQ